MAKENTNISTREDENREHCRHIAEEVEAYANGEFYSCPDCGEGIRLPDDVGDKYKCPHCGAVSDVNDLEQLSLWDYFADILDIDFVVTRDREYKACRILVAFGGPNIYISTDTAAVELFWWLDRARFPLSSDAVVAIDEWAAEYWNC